MKEESKQQTEDNMSAKPAEDGSAARTHQQKVNALKAQTNRTPCNHLSVLQCVQALHHLLLIPSLLCLKTRYKKKSIIMDQNRCSCLERSIGACIIPHCFAGRIRYLEADSFDLIPCYPGKTCFVRCITSRPHGRTVVLGTK